MKTFSVIRTIFIKNRNPLTGKAYNILPFPKAVMERLSTKISVPETKPLWKITILKIKFRHFKKSFCTFLADILLKLPFKVLPLKDFKSTHPSKR